jgi:hypothetical protein
MPRIAVRLWFCARGEATRVCALNRGRHLKVGILFIANGLIWHPRHQTGVHTDAVTTSSSYTWNRVHRAYRS